MATEQLEKLKNSIKSDLLGKFDKDLMISSGFIPVDIRNNDFYIIIKKSVASNKPMIETMAKDICNAESCVAKFISLADDEFGSLFEEIDFVQAEKTEPQSSEPQKLDFNFQKEKQEQEQQEQILEYPISYLL